MHLLKPAAGIILLAMAAFPASSAPARKTAAKPKNTSAAPAMTLHDKVAQLIIAPCYGDYPNTKSAEFRRYQHWVSDLHIGGLIVLNRVVQGHVKHAEPYALAAFLNRMQKFASVPLLIGADFERGASMRVDSTTKYPYSMAFGAARDIEAAHYLGAATAREARALGVHWVFAPDADVNNNPDNPIINIRSFGADPRAVAALVGAFIEGAHSEPKNRILVTAKHFPGEGDTTVDTHIGLARLEADRARIDQVELVPFRAAIEKGVDAVMTAHVAVPVLDPEGLPSTVSAKVLTNLLRNELNFSGLIVTDAMDMRALSKQFNGGEASVRALEAGADVLLMPLHPEESIRAVLAAIKDGRLSRKRIDQSVARVTAAKTRLGLYRKRLTDIEGISDVLDSPEASDKAQSIADRAVTLVKDEKGLLPLKNLDSACMLVLTEGRYSQQGRRLVEEMRFRAANMKITVLDPTTAAVELEEEAKESASCSTVIVAAFVTVSAFRGSVGLAGGLSNLVNSLVTGPVPVVLASFGNPYLLRDFPKSSAYLATFSTVVLSEVSAAKAMAGEIAITGHLPVSIPGLANIGDGIQLPIRPSEVH